MRKTILTLAMSALLLAFGSPAHAAPAAPGKVAVADMEQIVNESEPGKQAAEHLKKVQASLQQGFDELRERYKDAPEQERNRILAEGLNLLNRQMDLERLAASKRVNDVAVEEIEKWRKKQGALCVLPRSAVLAGDWEKLDCTKEILKAVNGRQVDFGNVPKVNIKEKVEAEAGKDAKDAKDTKDAKAPAKKK